jgi:uridylate kinase
MAKNGIEGVYDKDPNAHKDAIMFTSYTRTSFS